MTNDWAPEPWKLTEADPMSSFVEDGELDGIFEIEDRGMLYKIPDGTMHRIIACVNACAGVPTEVLLREAAGDETTTCSCGRIFYFSKPPPNHPVKEIRLCCRWCGDTTGVRFKEATDGHDNIGPPAHDNFRWFPDPEDL